MAMDAGAGRALRRPARWIGFQRNDLGTERGADAGDRSPATIRAGNFMVFSSTQGYSYVNLGAEPPHFVRNVIS